MSLLSVRPMQSSLFARNNSYETAGSLASASYETAGSLAFGYETAGSLASSSSSCGGSSSGGGVSCIA